MWLVICGTNDVSSLWAYQRLKARGLLQPLELITSELLAYSLYWEHRVGNDKADITIHLADGRTIQRDQLSGMLNRHLFLPSDHLRLADPDDRSYAQQEMMALFMSWLKCLPEPVLNRPTAQGLSGAWRHISEWVWLAAKSGLPTPNYQQSSADLRDEHAEQRLFPKSIPVKTVFVVASEVVAGWAERGRIGVVPPEIAQACKRLSRLTQTELLGIEFVSTAQHPWTFASATPAPDLRLGGEALLDVLTLALQGKLEGCE
jgi:hypothetical protein